MNAAEPGTTILIHEIPLKLDGVKFTPGDSKLTLEFNRPPTDQEVTLYRTLPPAPEMLADTQQYGARMQVAELVVRLFQFYILGSFVLPDTPLVMDWLRSYLEGNGGHGPLGKPLRWPVAPSAANILTRWGYERTPSGFVAKSA